MRHLNYFIITLSLLSIAHTLYWVISTYHPLPYLDAWVMPYVYDQLQTGQLTFSALIDNHNEHRILIPRLFFLIDYHFFHGTQLFLISSAVCLHLLFAYLLSRLFKNKMPQMKPIQFIALWLLFSALMLSPIQLVNFAMGFNIQYIISYLSAFAIFMLIIFATDQNRLLSAILAIIIATIGTLSLANALLIWFLMPVIMLRYQYQKTWVIFFSVLAIAVTFAYFRNFERVDTGGHVQYSLHHLAAWFEYIATLLANPLQYFGENIQKLSGFVIGLLCLFYFVVVFCKKNQINDILTLMMGYILVSILMVATARLEVGLYFASASRYTTGSFIALICLFSLVYFNLYPKKTPIFQISLLLLLIVSILGANRVETDFIHRLAMKKAVTNALLNDQLTDDIILKIFPKPELIKPFLIQLKKERLSIFYFCIKKDNSNQIIKK